MALVYVGGITGTGTTVNYAVSLTALTGGVGTTAIAGDLVIVSTGWADTADIDCGVTTAGFTEILDITSTDSRQANLSVNWKIMTSSPDTSVTCIASGSSANGGSAVVHVWRGADQTTPIDVTTVTATGANGALPVPPPLTPTTPGAIIIVTGMGTDDSTPLTQTVSAGYQNAFSVAGTGGTRNSVITLGSKNWNLGIETPAAFTGGETTISDAWCSATLAIRPAKFTTRLNNYQFAQADDNGTGAMSVTEKRR